jgi:hypothetical protein
MLRELFDDPVWQMSRGERAAIEGVLAAMKPTVAIEIGSMQGACLRRIALHAEEAHSFDLNPPTLPMPANVVLHTGNSHELLPTFLAEQAAEDRNVDLVVVDGDHSSEGVRQDIDDLLDSPALKRSVILIHDTANERVRRGLDAVHFNAWPKVTYVALDWIPGYLFAEPALRNELWFGLGLVIVDSSQLAYGNASVYEQRHHPSGPLLAQLRELVLAREQAPPGIGDRTEDPELQVGLLDARARERELRAQLVALQQRLDGAARALEDIKGSASWRITEPLRTAKRRAAQIKG